MTPKRPPKPRMCPDFHGKIHAKGRCWSCYRDYRIARNRHLLAIGLPPKPFRRARPREGLWSALKSWRREGQKYERSILL